MNLSDKLLCFFILLFLGFWGLFLFWWSFPYYPIVIKQPPKVINKVVKAGTALHYTIKFKKNINTVCRITRTLKNGISYTLTAEYPVNVAGDHNDNRYIIIPVDIPAGKFHFETEASCKVNPIREIAIIYYSDEFTVVK
jgi:hypothetical protein